MLFCSYCRIFSSLTVTKLLHYKGEPTPFTALLPVLLLRPLVLPYFHLLSEHVGGPTTKQDFKRLLTSFKSHFVILLLARIEAFTVNVKPIDVRQQRRRCRLAAVMFGLDGARGHTRWTHTELKGFAPAKLQPNPIFASVSPPLERFSPSERKTARK